MATQSASPAISATASSSLALPTASAPTDTYRPPTYTTFPPFYTLQPNLQTRARQLSLWSQHLTSYCAHHRIFRLNLSSPPPNLFSNESIHRALSQPDQRTLLDHLSLPTNGSRVEWIERGNAVWVYWRSLGEWADAIYGWVDETGQKGGVLTVYELREGEGVLGKEWQGMDEELLRKVLATLVKKGKCQIFGQEETAGVKFF